MVVTKGAEVVHVSSRLLAQPSSHINVVSQFPRTYSFWRSEQSNKRVLYSITPPFCASFYRHNSILVFSKKAMRAIFSLPKVFWEGF